jgi:hypothetical protein
VETRIVGAPAPEGFRGDLRERGVELRQHARGRLEQVEPDLLAAKARVVAEDVVGEDGELAEKLDAHEPSADQNLLSFSCPAH